jgi:hypothetical protein
MVSKEIFFTSKRRSPVKRLGLALLVSGLITPFVAGLINSNAGAMDDSQSHREKTFRDADVEGPYAFSFDGTVIGVGPVAATGVVVADGKGNITSGVRSLNFNGSVAQQTFTCTYSVNPDGTGSAICLLDNPLQGAPDVETFDFALEKKARAFRLLGTTAGFTVLGSGTKQR